MVDKGFGMELTDELLNLQPTKRPVVYYANITAEYEEKA